MLDILRIKNWEEYQHYTKRSPPWIKLHFNILQSRDWVMLDDAGRVLAIACMLLASRSDLQDGQFEADPEYFKRVAYLNSEPNFKPLIELGFLEVASGCKQLLADDSKCYTEKETEEEEEAYKEEVEKREKTNGANAPSASAVRFDEFWTVYPKKREKKKSREIWKRKKLDAKADEIIDDVVMRDEQDSQWRDGYIPNPTTYLRGERWEDEITKPRSVAKEAQEYRIQRKRVINQ